MYTESIHNANYPRILHLKITLPTSITFAHSEISLLNQNRHSNRKCLRRASQFPPIFACYIRTRARQSISHALLPITIRLKSSIELAIRPRLNKWLPIIPPMRPYEKYDSQRKYALVGLRSAPIAASMSGRAHWTLIVSFGTMFSTETLCIF